MAVYKKMELGLSFLTICFSGVRGVNVVRFVTCESMGGDKEWGCGRVTKKISFWYQNFFF